jgi:hypothetical protein
VTARAIVRGQRQWEFRSPILVAKIGFASPTPYPGNSRLRSIAP